MLLILFSLIKWNIFKIAPALTFHIIYVVSHQTLHMKASPQWVWKEFPSSKKKKKNLFLISCYYHTTGHVHMQLLFCRLWIQGVNEPRSS